MYSRVVVCLQCPLCHDGLTEAEAGSGRALRCAKGHSFDIAKQGYANLGYPPPAYSGDTSEMVASRAGFLAAGHYRFVADAVAGAAKLLHSETEPGLIVEAGAGTGYYLGVVLDALAGSTGLALDVSKAALRRAAKAHPRAAAALCDVWRELPVSDGAAGLVLSIFAPRNGAEFKRVLAVDGALIVVAPTSAHLQELVGPLGLLSVGANKDEAVAASLGDGFLRVDEQRHDQLLQLTHSEIHALVQMGPSAWHVDLERLATAISALPEVVPVTASVHVSSFRVQ
jgi:23S rRNA (guanine745-N1)-methyltransferase